MHITLSADPDLPLLTLDPVKISQSLQNLLSNAIQHSPSGARIDVRLRTVREGVEIEVEDRGPGNPPAEMSDLFRPYTRLSTSTGQKSVGLGLAITRRLIEAHGGTIGVESEVGKGSLFRNRAPA